MDEKIYRLFLFTAFAASESYYMTDIGIKLPDNTLAKYQPLLYYVIVSFR